MTVVINGTTGYSGPVGTIGDLTTTGNTTLGDASGDTLTINGSTTTLTQGTANGVAYLNGSKALTTGSALVFDGTNLGVGGSPVAVGSSPVLEIYSGANNGILKFTNSTTGTTNSDGTWLYQPAGSNNFVVQNQESAGDLRLFSTAHIWGNHNYSTEYMRLTSTGLGIGTSSPSGKLTVKTGTDENFSVLTGGGGDMRIAALNDAVSSTVQLSIQASPLLFRGAGGAEVARLDASGNLYLGATSGARGGATTRQLVKMGSGQYYLELQATGTSTDGTGVLFSDGSTGAYGLIAYDHTTDALTFYSNSSERARIDSSGRLLLGRTSGYGYQLEVQSDQYLTYYKTTTTYGQIVFIDSGDVQRGYIQYSSGGTTYATSSDYRLKDNIAPMTGALAKVAALKPVTYTWKSDGSDGQGFIAHELAEVVPQCVTGEKDAVDADGNPVYQGIDTSFLVATLTAAIQEQQAIIETLKARLDAANL